MKQLTALFLALSVTCSVAMAEPELDAATKAEIDKASAAIAAAPTAANYAERARIYRKTHKHYAQALPDDNKAIELDTGDAFYWMVRGGDYMHLAQWEKGITDLTRAIALSRKGDEVYVNALRARFHCYNRSGRAKEAQADKQALLDLHAWAE